MSKYAYDQVVTGFKQLKHDEHCYVMACRDAASKLRTQYFEALGVEDVATIILDYFPSYMERRTLANLIGMAETPQEFADAFKQAQRFKEVTTPFNPFTCNNDFSNLQGCINNLQEYFAIATDVNSEEGSSISSNELQILHKHIRRAKVALDDITKCIVMNTKTKELR